MNAEKEVPIFGSYWQVRVHVFGANFAIRIVCQSAPQNPFGGVNCHLVANLGLRRGHQPNYRIRNIRSARVSEQIPQPKIVIPNQFQIHDMILSTTN